MKALRKLLFPFAILYDGITRLRNWLYDIGWLSSTSFAAPVICVGNLSVGGTGKSPMVEYLVRLFEAGTDVAVLSRGYGRTTSGFLWVEEDADTSQVGDEPLQIKKKFPSITMAVCENRVLGAQEIFSSNHRNLLILDDAFQHRRINPSFSILLTAFQDPYYQDYLLPTGNLREHRGNAKRADAVVVTKCPEDISPQAMDGITDKISKTTQAPVFFATLRYASHIFSEEQEKPLNTLRDTEFLLVTGIANPQPLVNFLHAQGMRFQHMAFGDHHNFTVADIERIEESADGKIILTTEKDFMRLAPRISDAPLFYLPVAHAFIRAEKQFQELVLGQRKKA